MLVAFRRTGKRRYATVVTLPGRSPQALDPAPGYDDDIPHDLVHYLVEAELGLRLGVYGSAERGGGGFIPSSRGDAGTRERARAKRKQERREKALRACDSSRNAEMRRSERLALACDVAWRRMHGQRPDPNREAPDLRAEDQPHVERVVARLDAVAPLWRALAIDGELVFEWPCAAPSRRATGG